MNKVYVSRKMPPAAMEALAKVCPYDLNAEDRAATRQELAYALQHYEAVVTMLNDPVDAELIAQAGPNLKIIANCAVGFNNIDVKAAHERGIYVSNTPDVLNDATADLGWALLFAAARRIVEGDNIVRHGKIGGGLTYMLGADITGQTLGIIGAGRIGFNFARKGALGFGMKVLYFSRHDSPAFDELGAKRVSLDELLAQSDYVSLHCPLTPETRHLIGAEELAKMKRTAILINTSRGPVVDEKALVSALANRTIAAAGLDVYEHEPDVEPGLKELPNVVMSPHVGSATLNTRNNMGFMVVRNIEAALKGETPPNAVRV